MKKLILLIVFLAVTTVVCADEYNDAGYHYEVLNFIEDSIDAKLAVIKGPVVSGDQMFSLAKEIHRFYNFRQLSNWHMRNYWGWRLDYFSGDLDPRIKKIHDLYWHTFWDRDLSGQTAVLLSQLCQNKIDRVESHLSTFCLIAMIVLLFVAVIFGLLAYANFRDYPPNLKIGIFQGLIALAIIIWLFF